MISIQHLSKSFGKQKVLDGLSLELSAGMVYGIVGENGAGKTTLFRCMTGLESFDGELRYTLDNPTGVMGYLPTEPYFFSRMTGREYLHLLCSARKKVMGDLDKKNIFDLPLDQYVETYSTGMKKKIALLGTLLQGNEIFILDEPFNGVDIQSNILMAEIIHELKRKNKTVILSSHIFSTLTEVCDVIHLLKSGKIEQSAWKADFAAMENEMKKVMIGQKIHLLEL